MALTSSSFSPEIQLPALQSDAPSVLRRTITNRSELPRSQLAALRAQVVSVFNAGLETDEEGQEEVKNVASDFQLGLSYIHYRKGDTGVQEYMTPETCSKVLAIGRKLRREQISTPISRIRAKNALPNNAVLSTTVEFATGSRGARSDVPLSSSTFIDTFHAGHSSSYPSLLQFTQDATRLERILSLQDYLSLKQESIQMSRSNIESSVSHVIRHVGSVSFLELAVFCAAFAQRHHLQLRTPLALNAENAQKFRSDFDRGWNFKPGTLEEYERACEQVFKDLKEEAWLVLQLHLEQVTEMLVFDRNQEDQIVIEHYFPVERVPRERLRFLFHS